MSFLSSASVASGEPRNGTPGDVDTGGLLQPLHHQVIDGAEARDAVVHLAGIGARIVDEFASVRAGTSGLENSTSGTSDDLGNRRQRRQRIERHLDQELVDDEVVGGRDQDRVAVGLGARDFLRADVAGRARLCLDHELLAELLLHADREQPHDVLGHAAGGVGNDDPDRPFGIGRRPRAVPLTQRRRAAAASELAAVDACALRTALRSYAKISETIACRRASATWSASCARRGAKAVVTFLVRPDQRRRHREPRAIAFLASR